MVRRPDVDLDGDGEVFDHRELVACLEAGFAEILALGDAGPAAH